MKDWDVSEITDLDDVFEGLGDCQPEVSNWDTSKVTSMDRVFEGLASYTGAGAGSVSKWDVSKVRIANPVFALAVCCSLVLV